MLTINARCTCGPRKPFKAFKVARRELGPHDVLIDIAYVGICHSDIDHAYSTRGKTLYPLVPGHEIAGIVSAIGSDVAKFAVGDRAGVGCMVDSCRECPECLDGLEQYCRGKRVLTYNSIDRHGKPTYGGYSEKIVVHEDFVLHIPQGITLQSAAPLFCAGITLYSPLRHWGAGPGKRVAIVGFGGLGHVGVKIAHALGAHTTVLDLSLEKREDGMRMGADDFRATSDPATFAELADSIDLIISTVPGNLDMKAFLGLLRRDGTFVNLGVPEQPLSIDAVALLRNRRSVAGTLSGGLPETQEMIDFCASHGIGAEVEVISADQIDEAYRRLIAGDVRYRFVIDVNTMANLD